ncbi:MAG: amidohydrolase family protein [Planctomycetes bacterium]|nr:amidohydrolase family protein [Planctomycetota bacterium]
MRSQLTRRAFIRTAAAGSVALTAFGARQGPAAPADGAEQAESPFTLATMPRVDVHTHIGNTWPILDQVIELRQSLLEKRQADLAMCIGLGRAEPPDLVEMRTRYQGRIQFCISDFDLKHGKPFRFSPEDLEHWLEQGVVGFKFYPGWQPGIQIDRAANDPIFDKMEQIGMVAASPHVTNPCGTFGRRTEWFSDPVEFWRQQRAWENVLKKHPRLVVVNAHMLWLCYSDEQLDCLRYMLETYPNLNVDLATTPAFLHAVGRDNLREFMIQYADRILFGTDMASSWFVPALDKQLPNIRDKAPQYQRYFDLLETDKELPSGIKDEHKMRGLALPLDVLEKIYFRNAMRIYPHVAEALTELGYFGKDGTTSSTPS